MNIKETLKITSLNDNKNIRIVQFFNNFEFIKS